MLVYEDLIEKLKEHFPRWMDIRRKINSSVGGQYLKSIASAISDIQPAINDYKKDFFINNYFGKENEIMAFMYKMPVGITSDVSDIEILYPENFNITLNEDIFYENDKYAYYKDGMLYFKNNYNEIKYKVYDYTCTGETEKIHVWNVFDEFAAFLGLRRYQWETNLELENRILSYGKVSNKVNSSSDGLKNALIANLINIAPELTKDDIKIERPTAENLVKYYDEFETILDHMSKINKDVYKEKQWDIDIWNLDIKSIDYIPHAWDVLLNDYVNGIGFKDDLKVELIDQNQTCDVSIFFYKKHIDELNKYIKNHNIKYNAELDLIKYNDKIKEEQVKYRITASKALKINTDKISFKAIEEKTGSFDINLQDIIKDYDKSELNEEDKSILSDEYNYILSFIPLSETGDFRIDSCRQIDNETGNFKNLLDSSREGFESSGDGIKSTVSKHYIENLYQLEAYENIQKTINGFEISDLSKSGRMQINVDGCRLLPLIIDYENRETIFNLSDFKLNNCYVYNDVIYSDTVDGDKTAEINIQMNSFSAVITGPYKIEYSINNEEAVILTDKSNSSFNFVIEKRDMPQNLKLKITFLESGCKIKDVRYSKYELSLSLANGDINYDRDNMYLPSDDINTLYVNIKSYIGFSPIIKYIYIGNKLKESDGYYNIHFNTADGTKLDAKYSGCRLQLKECDKTTNEIINIIEDYRPYKKYTARKTAYVSIDIDDYIVSKIEAENCEIKTDNYNGINKEYIIVIPENESVMSIKVTGTCYLPVIDCTLTSILERRKINIANTDVYATKNKDSLIIKNKLADTISYMKITKNDLFGDKRSNTIVVSSESDDIAVKFIEKENKFYTNKYSNEFDYVSFEPRTGAIHTAINSYSMIFPFKNDIPIVNTFNNNYSENDKFLYFYTIESLNENFYVRFQTDADFKNCQCFVLDSCKIAIKSKAGVDFSYDYSEIKILFESPLSSSIEIPQLLNHEEKDIDIREYYINEDNIEYSNKESDPSNIYDYEYSENKIMNENGIIKLKFCNINEIESISANGININEDSYELMKKEGIIIIRDTIEKDMLVRINYNINIPKRIKIEEDKLYKLVKYPVNSMMLLNELFLKDVQINTPTDLKGNPDYINSDIVSVQCSKPGFLTRIDNGCLIISNNTKKNTIAVKTGYYYMNGREYYLLADEKYDNVNKIDNINYHNVTKDNYNLILKIKSSNFLKNTSFDLNTKSEIYNLNCQDKNIIPVSEIMEVSACDNYNYWENYMCSLSITNGYNDLALKFNSDDEYKGYCYLSLDKYLKHECSYTLSFYLKGGDCYLGREKKLESERTDFNYNSVIEPYKKIESSTVMQDFYEIVFENTENDKYYLILSGTGIIDDIIISETENYDIYNHVKNTTKLNLNFDENIYSKYQTRLFVSDKNGAVFDGTELDEEKCLHNSSYINWGYTKLKEISSYDDFKQCIISDVRFKQFDGKCSVISGSSAGYVETSPLYISDPKVINNLLFKINNIMFEDTSSLDIKVLTSYNKNSGYKEIAASKSNLCIIQGNYIDRYIKLQISIPAGKRLDSVEYYAEYLSNDENHPKEIDVTDGIYISKVLDAQYNQRYTLKAISVENDKSADFICQIRASKDNAENTVWTSWKTIELDDEYNITNRITFDNYRYFQFRIELKGKNSSIKINHIDLEVV